MSVDHRDLISEDFYTAAYKKYQRGRREHGAAWVGPRPLLCLHDELLDAYVYADLEYAKGDVDRSVLLEVMEKIADLRQGVKTLIESVPQERWDGWARREPDPT